MTGGISLNFELDYVLLHQKMTEFLDNHSEEITKIVSECFRVSAPDPVQRLIEKKGSLSDNVPRPDEAFSNMFPSSNKEI